MEPFSFLPTQKNEYLPLEKYVQGMSSFHADSGWKIPLSLKDKLQLLLLRFVVSWSWFANRLYIKDATIFGLGYDQLFNYLEENLFEFGLAKQNPRIETWNQYQWRFFIKSNDGSFLPLALGVGSNNNTALSKAFGEGLERYFSLWSKANTVATNYSGTYEEAQKRGFDTCFPVKYHSYTSAQLKKYPYFFQEKTYP